MAELQTNIEQAVANAAAKIASAETIEEAQQWQSIISNLTSALQQVDRVNEPVIQPVLESGFEDLNNEENSTDEINVEDGNGN